MKQMTIGVVGCGVISEVYLKNLNSRFSGVKVTACADTFPEKARERARQFGLMEKTVEALLEDPTIDVVLNLTTPQSHADISLRALAHGKHVYCEKPLAAVLEDAKQVLALAQEKHLRVGCAPDTFLGGGLQTALQAVKDGWIGRPLAATAFVASRGHERWHANPSFYYQPGGGPHLDMGPYYLTVLVACLGRVRRVSAMSGRAFATRRVWTGPAKGSEIPVNVDTHWSALLEFECGVIATVIFSFDLWANHLPRLELYGSAGTLALPDPNTFDGPVLLQTMHESAFQPLPLRYPYTGDMRGLGLAQMCRALRSGAPHCANGALACHVLEVLLAMQTASATVQSVECVTSCTCPPLLPPGLTELEYEL